MRQRNIEVIRRIPGLILEDSIGDVDRYLVLFEIVELAGDGIGNGELEQMVRVSCFRSPYVVAVILLFSAEDESRKDTLYLQSTAVSSSASGASSVDGIFITAIGRSRKHRAVFGKDRVFNRRSRKDLYRRRR